MANFTVSYDITMSGLLDVEALTEEEARQVAAKTLSNDPYYFARKAMSHVRTEIIDIDCNLD